MYNGEEIITPKPQRPSFQHQQQTDHPLPIGTPFSDVSSSSASSDGGPSTSDKDLRIPADWDCITPRAFSQNGRPSSVPAPQTRGGGYTALTQAHAERARASHIARVAAVTGRLNPYANEASARVGALTTSVYARVQTHHAWISPLDAGIAADDAKMRHQCAAELTGSQRWNTDGGASLHGLAAMIVERAVEGEGYLQRQVAAFVQEVTRVFRNACGESCAAAFKEAVGRAVWAEFEAWWEPSKPTALCTGVYKDTQKAALLPALAILAFMGDLWSQSTTAVAHHAFQILVRDMASIEHLRAFRTLLSRLDVRFKNANVDAMNHAMCVIFQNYSLVRTSFLGEPFDLKLLTTQWQEIDTCVIRWELPSSRQGEQRPSDQAMNLIDSTQGPSNTNTPVMAPTAIWQPARTYQGAPAMMPPYSNAGGFSYI